jgi:tRNA A-37 threonylcarbamoyl transferase component Bud32
MATDVTCLQCGKPYDADVVENKFAGVCPSCLAGFALQGTDTVQPSPGAADPTIQPPLKVGGTFHGLEIVELLGAGGMGVVYKARHPGLDRFVALKILSPRLAEDPEFASRFSREARALAALSHPNIVQIYDVGREAGLYFLTMEYVDGASLRTLMKDRRLAPEDAVRIVPQICDALEYAHSEGVVHRDIKPENLLLDRRGRVRIADFGLAKLVGRETRTGGSTLSGVVMGTPGYMAPEQVMSMNVDHRADIYSLGAVFYEMLTGEIPLGRFDPPSRRVQVDVRLDEVVLRALEKEPGRRYQRASEFATGVQTLGALRAPAQAPVATAKKKTPETVWLALIFLGVAYFIPGMGLRRSREIEDVFPLFTFFSLASLFCAVASLIRIDRHPLTTGGRGLALLAIFLSFPPAGVFAGSLAWLICDARERRRADPAARGVPVVLTVFLVFGLLLSGACGGCLLSGEAGSSPRPMASLGRGKSAEPHGPHCSEFTAIGELDSNHYAAKAFVTMAGLSLTTHEEMHLVDEALDTISSDHYRKEVFVALARNRSLTEGGRAYLVESLKILGSDHRRTEVLRELGSR